MKQQASPRGRRQDSPACRWGLERGGGVKSSRDERVETNEWESSSIKELLKLLVTSASLVVTGALLVVTRSY